MSGIRERTRAACVLLALGALGSLVVHQLAYAVVSRPGTGHGHLSIQWAIITPLAVILAAGTVLRQVRQLGVHCPTTGLRVGLVSGSMFAIQEMIEAGLAGGSIGTVLVDASTVVGLLIAPLVGVAIAALLRRAAEAVASWVPPTEFVAGPQRPSWTPAARLFVDRIVVSAASPRGPPEMLLTQ